MAGSAPITAAGAVGQARAVLRSAVDAAHVSGGTVLDDGSVLPPARPAVPGGLTPQDLTVWQQQADATAATQVANAARLAQQIAAALSAAGAAELERAGAYDQPRAQACAARPVRRRLGRLGRGGTATAVGWGSPA